MCKFLFLFSDYKFYCWQEAEKELRRTALLLEKERREKERDELRVSKLKEKEKEKEVVKLNKEKNKFVDKARHLVKKEVASEQKRLRSEAVAIVLERFDEEEDALEMQTAISAPLMTSSNLSSLIVSDKSKAMPTIEFLMQNRLDNNSSGIFFSDLENAIDVTTCLQAHQGFIKSSSKVFQIDNFLSLLRTAEGSSATPAEPDDSTSLARINSEYSYVDAYDESRSRTQNTESELDRMQLYMLQPVVKELNDLLGLEEPDNSEDPTVSRRQKRAFSRGNLMGSLPLNQLTWLELFRMCIIMRIGQELEKSDEEVKKCTYKM